MGLFGRKKYSNAWDEYTEGGRLQPAPSAYTLEQLTPEQRKELKKRRMPEMKRSTKEFEKRQKEARKADRKTAKNKQAEQAKQGKKKSGWW